MTVRVPVLDGFDCQFGRILSDWPVHKEKRRLPSPRHLFSTTTIEIGLQVLPLYFRLLYSQYWIPDQQNVEDRAGDDEDDALRML